MRQQHEPRNVGTCLNKRVSTTAGKLAVRCPCKFCAIADTK